jgi:hypothetical protein
MSFISTVVTFVVALLALATLIVAGLVLFAAFITRSVEKAVPPLGKFTDVDGARLHYLDRGHGPTIVMIHGLTGQMRNFTHSLVDLLTDDPCDRDRSPGLRVFEPRSRRRGPVDRPRRSDWEI